jgi:hypothetical protein
MKLNDKQKKAFESFYEKPELTPGLPSRPAIMSNAPVGDGVALGQQLQKIDAADKANIMKQLEELEQVGAFESPDSEANQAAGRFRKLLGK